MDWCMSFVLHSVQLPAAARAELYNKLRCGSVLAKLASNLRKMIFLRQTGIDPVQAPLLWTFPV